MLFCIITFCWIYVERSILNVWIGCFQINRNRNRIIQHIKNIEPWAPIDVWVLSENSIPVRSPLPRDDLPTHSQMCREFWRYKIEIFGLRDLRDASQRVEVEVDLSKHNDISKDVLDSNSQGLGRKEWPKDSLERRNGFVVTIPHNLITLNTFSPHLQKIQNYKGNVNFTSQDDYFTHHIGWN